MVQKQIFPQQPNLLYSTGLINSIKEDLPPSTGHMGWPIAHRERHTHEVLQARVRVMNNAYLEAHGLATRL